MLRRDFIKCFGAVPFLSFLNISTSPVEMNNAFRKGKTTLDNIFQAISDLQIGDLVVIGGSPSKGKTAVAINLLSVMGVQKNLCCAYFSLESSKENLMRRWIAIEANLPASQINEGRLSLNDFNIIAEASDRISKSKVFIDDTAGIPIEEICLRVENLKFHHKNLKYIFVDYIQLVDSKKRHRTRRDQVAHILSELKRVASKEQVVIIALTQLNRDVEGRLEKRPILSGIRELNDYSSIDKALLVYRDDYRDKSVFPALGPAFSSLVLISAKSKQGIKKTIYCVLDRRSGKLS